MAIFNAGSATKFACDLLQKVKAPSYLDIRLPALKLQMYGGRRDKLCTIWTIAMVIGIYLGAALKWWGRLNCKQGILCGPGDVIFPLLQINKI